MRMRFREVHEVDEKKALQRWAERIRKDLIARRDMADLDPEVFGESGLLYGDISFDAAVKAFYRMPLHVDGEIRLVGLSSTTFEPFAKIPLETYPEGTDEELIIRDLIENYEARQKRKDTNSEYDKTLVPVN